MLSWGMLNSRMKDWSAAKDLSIALATRDISAQYRQSFLGVFWILLIPIVNSAVWLLLNNSGSLTITVSGMSYKSFLISGTVLWSIFVDSLNMPLNQFSVNRQMLAKINFPRESLILSGIIVLAINSVIKVAAALILLKTTGAQISGYILIAPYPVALIMLIGICLGLLLLPIGILYDDVKRILPYLTQAIMLLTPVVFPESSSGLMGLIMGYNPLVPIFRFARYVMIGDSNIYHFLSQLISTMPIFALSTIAIQMLWLIIKASLPVYIERMSS